MEGVESSLLPKKEIVEGNFAFVFFFPVFVFWTFGPFFGKFTKKTKSWRDFKNVINEWPCPLRVLTQLIFQESRAFTIGNTLRN